MRRQNQLLLLMLLSCVVLTGCIQMPIDEALFKSYNDTKLGESSSGDVLIFMDTPQTTLLSQADTIVASWGEDKKGYREWLNMTAFDEESGSAARKYFFFVDEKARRIPFLHPKWSARFDGQLTLDKVVLEKPYADEKVRNIAILKEIQKQFSQDIAKVAGDNKKLGTCQTVVNESVEQALQQLNESPALATKLTEEQGFTFESRNFDKGTIQMHEADGIVTIKIQTGPTSWLKAKSEPGRPYEPPAAP